MALLPPYTRLAMDSRRPPIDIYPEIAPAQRAASNLRTVGRFWWLIAICVLLAAGAGYVISAHQPHRYDATAKVLLTNAEPVNVLDRRTSGSRSTPSET